MFLRVLPSKRDTSSDSIQCAQLDEAEDLLEQWRAERRARQAPVGVRARRAATSTSRARAGEGAQGHSHLSSRPCAGGHASDRGGSDSDNAMESAVSRIRRRLGMHGKGAERRWAHRSALALLSANGHSCKRMPTCTSLCLQPHASLGFHVYAHANSAAFQRRVWSLSAAHARNDSPPLERFGRRCFVAS